MAEKEREGWGVSAKADHCADHCAATILKAWVDFGVGMDGE